MSTETPVVLPDDETLKQLAQHGYEPNGPKRDTDRPILICDVDEVVLHLVDPFVEVIEERGYELRTRAFKLTGNVFHRETGEEATQAQVWEGLTQLFEEQESRQGLVDGVVDGLAHVAEHADIVFLTNMPHPFADIRRRHLTAEGLHYPLITNMGSKLPAINLIEAQRNAKVAFVDDTPRNLRDVANGNDRIQLFHFMANDDFRKLAGEIEGAHFSSGDWAHAAPLMVAHMVENT
ncbi:MAG: hypothetical protein AAF035_09750 [Pseudomonadota bacterium]